MWKYCTPIDRMLTNVFHELFEEFKKERRVKRWGKWQYVLEKGEEDVRVIPYLRIFFITFYRDAKKLPMLQSNSSENERMFIRINSVKKIITSNGLKAARADADSYTVYHYKGIIHRRYYDVGTIKHEHTRHSMVYEIIKNVFLPIRFQHLESIKNDKKLREG